MASSAPSARSNGFADDDAEHLACFARLDLAETNEQVRVARGTTGRARRLVQSDAHRLPLADLLAIGARR